jgi:hypothetical protein
MWQGSHLAPVNRSPRRTDRLTRQRDRSEEYSMYTDLLETTARVEAQELLLSGAQVYVLDSPIGPRSRPPRAARIRVGSIPPDAPGIRAGRDARSLWNEKFCAAVEVRETSRIIVP